MVFNFNGFGNVAAACSASVVAGPQMLQANHHQPSGYLCNRSGWRGTRHGDIWGPQRSRGWSLRDQSGKQSLLSSAEPPVGMAFPWFSLRVLRLILS